MDRIFLVYENADMTEGRGPMIHVRNSGFFTSEDDAWAFADTRRGVMGREPGRGSWRHEQYGDITVIAIDKHNGEKHKHRYEIEQKIESLQKELNNLK